MTSRTAIAGKVVRDRNELRKNIKSVVKELVQLGRLIKGNASRSH